MEMSKLTWDLAVFKISGLIWLLILFSCDYPHRYQPNDPAPSNVRCSIEVESDTAIVYTGDTFQARVMDVFCSGEKKLVDAALITWESSPQGIVSIDGEGIVTGLAPGQVSLIAHVDTISAFAVIEVGGKPDISRVVITEVVCNPEGSDTGKEFIEIFNGNLSPVNIAGFSLIDGSSGSKKLMFKENTVIPPSGFFVIAADPVLFKEAFGITPDYSGFTFTLNNTGEHVALLGSDGAVVDEVYIDGGTKDNPVPLEWGAVNLPASKEGMSVIRTEPLVDTNTFNDWTSAKPSPGRDSL
jgi:hypothetical protein